jgi:hypothetical protein
MRSMVSPRTTLGRRDFENAVVLLIGWAVAFAVTWT